ncbi:MAG: DUF3048 domain-containing protein [Candidatus Kerfeldbacteria bacterium]|nr:DUF3048 domain-containing protein [Candidatus Kerfeldbacteria bacterium]
MEVHPRLERLREFFWSLRENKKARRWFAVVAFVLLLLIGTVVFLIVHIHGRRNQAVTNVSETISLNLSDANGSQHVGRRFIDGAAVEQGKENQLPVLMMIENFIAVRPQSGLQAANVVYEALAEGGITRFMAVYANDEAINDIGPIRSARPYFVSWADEYRGVYGHVGGSPEAINNLHNDQLLVYDLDQMYHGPYYRREESIAAPHNLFTNTTLLAYALRDLQFTDMQGTFAPWKFSSPVPLDQRPQEERQITLPFSSMSYEVRYVYHRDENRYLRWNGGVEHTDALTKQQIQVKNIAVQFVTTRLTDETTGRLAMTTIGEGRAVVFHDGTAQEGTWKRSSAEDRTRFYTNTGEEISFIPGNIWVEVLPDDRSIEYN